MKTTVVGTGTNVSMLDALRQTIGEADEALLCSAFVNRAGVHLLESQLAHLGDRARVAVTSAFGGPSTVTAMAALQDTGALLRVVNPSRGTFHPKLYVGRSGLKARALIGSANMTSGLVTNVEVGVLLEGDSEDVALRHAWQVATDLWGHAAAQLWQPLAAGETDETFSADLFRVLQRAVAENPVFLTLADGKPNRVVDVTRSGIWIETTASMAKGRPAQEVPAWMFELAWDYLRTHGELTNRHLLATDGLNVKRSSAVSAVLARLPRVEVTSTRPITLTYRE